MTDWPTPTLIQRLRDAGLQPTLQRLAVAAVMLEQPVHRTAEQVLEQARSHLPGISRATVYDTLQRFAACGLLRPLVIDGVSSVYDSTTTPHHHVYDLDTGAVSDLPEGQLHILGVPDLGEGVEIAEVDVVVRVRQRRAVGPSP